MIARMRADRLLVERGLFESRAKAQAAIEAGLVTAGNVPVGKPSDEIAIDAELRAEPAHPWVSRGGVKLAAALDHFGFDPTGRVCIDVGASTGGFTDVLVARGARRVYAVDVGHGQLHRKIAVRSEVTAFEGTDIRNLPAMRLTEPPDFAVVDVSFISLKLVLPAVTPLLRRPAHLIALIKPQFEAGRGRVKKGVVRDETARTTACDDIARAAAALGWGVGSVIASPITGGDGNQEYLLGARFD